MIKRADFVVNTVLDFILRNVTSFPVDLFQIAADNNVRVVSLTEHIASGLTEEQAFALWGNDDGAAMFVRGRLIIGYNDRKPAKRIRFTLAHEIMHIVLGHLLDNQADEFSSFYRPDIAAEYEDEANLAAGLLLCNPKICYNLRNCLNEQLLQRLFDVSRDCALRTLNDLNEYGDVIHKNRLYRQLDMPILDPNVVLPERMLFDFVPIWPAAKEVEQL